MFLIIDARRCIRNRPWHREKKGEKRKGFGHSLKVLVDERLKVLYYILGREFQFLKLRKKLLYLKIIFTEYKIKIPQLTRNFVLYLLIIFLGFKRSNIF